MAQDYAIELYLDPALENQILKAWNVLARRQISTHLFEIKSRPHVTLLSCHFSDIHKIEAVLRNFAPKQDPLPISLSSIGTLLNESNVLFLSPTPTFSLLQFHLQLYDAMRREGVQIADGSCPDKWVPHCPVAEEVPRARVAEAFGLLHDLKMPFSGYAMEISLVEYSPVREIFSFALGANPHISDV